MTAVLMAVAAEAAHEMSRAQALREEAAELRVAPWLRRIARLRALPDRRAALGFALEGVASVLACDTVLVQRVVGARAGSVLEAQYGAQPLGDYWSHLSDDSGTPCSQALLERRLVVVRDVLLDPAYMHTEALEALLAAGARAVLAVPLIDRGTTVGVLSVHYRRPRSRVQAECRHLRTLGAALTPLLQPQV